MKSPLPKDAGQQKHTLHYTIHLPTHHRKKMFVDFDKSQAIEGAIAGRRFWSLMHPKFKNGQNGNFNLLPYLHPLWDNE